MNMSIKDFILSIIVRVFGDFWYIFILYMIFNILDWITGSLKAIKLKNVSSYLGVKGLIKKLGYWIVIGIAFSISCIFVIIGKKILSVNLSFMYSLGWFTFAILLVNEVISILENLVALKIKVPNILIRSLKVTDNILDNVSDKILDQDTSINNKNKKTD